MYCTWSDRNMPYNQAKKANTPVKHKPMQCTFRNMSGLHHEQGKPRKFRWFYVHIIRTTVESESVMVKPAPGTRHSSACSAGNHDTQRRTVTKRLATCGQYKVNIIKQPSGSREVWLCLRSLILASYWRTSYPWVHK